jgi:single-strand DNA-binding protein
MISINRMEVQGNLGKDPEVITFQPSGRIKAELSIATNSKWRDAQGQEIKTTEWHTVILWGKQAEIAQKYLHKGDTVWATGPIETRKWDDKDGKTHYMKEIRAREFKFSTRAATSAPAQSASPAAPADDVGSGYVEEPSIDEQAAF